MSESSKSAMEAASNHLMLFLVLFLVSYTLLSLVVHKAPVFSAFSRESKKMMVSVASLLVLGVLAYCF